MLRIMFLTVALTLCGSTVRAQANPDSVKLRNDCRLAQQVLTTGQPATHRQEALTIIGLCGREGVPALLSTWSSVGADRPTLGLLVTSTRAYANQQIVDALLGTLNQPARPLEVRVASLQVLLTFADPAVTPSFDDFLGDSTELLIRRYGAIDHPFPVVGLETLSGSLTDQLREGLRVIAASDPDARMRLTARIALLNEPLK